MCSTLADLETSQEELQSRAHRPLNPAISSAVVGLYTVLSPPYHLYTVQSAKIVLYTVLSPQLQTAGVTETESRQENRLFQGSKSGPRGPTHSSPRHPTLTHCVPGPPASRSFNPCPSVQDPSSGSRLQCQSDVYYKPRIQWTSSTLKEVHSPVLKSRCVSELSTVQAASLSASSGPVSHGSQIQVCVRALNCASRLALRLIWSCVSRLSNPGVCQSSQLCKPPRSPPHLVLCLTALKSRCVRALNCASRLALRLIWSCVSRLSNPGVCTELSTVQAASLSASSGPVSHGSQIQVCVRALNCASLSSLSASSGPVSHGSQIQVCVQSSQLCKPPRSPPHLVLCLTALKSRCVSELSTVQAASLSASSGPVSHGSQIQVCVRALNCASRLALRLSWSCVSRLSNPGVCQSSQLCKPASLSASSWSCVSRLSNPGVCQSSQLCKPPRSPPHPGPVSHGSQIQVITTEGSA